MMACYGGSGESWQEAHDKRETQSQYARRLEGIGADNFRFSSGECEGCGAVWLTHPLQNALAKGANECCYCRRPRQ